MTKRPLPVGRLIASLLVVVLASGCAGSVPTASGPGRLPGSTTGPSVTITIEPTSSPSFVPLPTPSAAGPSPSIAIPKPGPDGTAYLKANVARSAAKPAAAKSAAAAVNAFAADLYRRLPAGKNVVFSPASIAIALGMTRPGARGETATQIDAVTRNIASDDHAAWINALDRAVRSRNAGFKDSQGSIKRIVLTIANAAFAQRDYPFEYAYLVALAQRYGSGIRLVDFKADPAAARRAINAWVKARTTDRIKQLLGPADVTTNSRLVLANAIYLKAPWAVPFRPKETSPGIFHRMSGSPVTVPMMHGEILDGSFVYASGKGWQAAERAYVGAQLAMTIIVPDNLTTFESHLTPALLSRIDASLKVQAGEIWLPKFSIDTKTKLGTILEAMGMPAALDPATADFSGIANPAVTGEPLYITKVVHQANIDVDEKGTEAAAATAVELGAGGGPERWVSFHVDRPFIFLVRDVPTGAILFMGRVADPSIR